MRSVSGANQGDSGPPGCGNGDLAVGRNFVGDTGRRLVRSGRGGGGRVPPFLFPATLESRRAPALHEQIALPHFFILATLASNSS
jgi:hypothetical protein